MFSPLRAASALMLTLFIMLLGGLAAPAAFAVDRQASTSALSMLADTASWAMLAAVVTPLLTSVAQRPSWPKRVRVAISVAVSVVVALVTLLANGAFNEGPQTVLSIIALVVVTSAASYRNIWKPSGIALAIESATSPKPSPDHLDRE